MCAIRSACEKKSGRRGVGAARPPPRGEGRTRGFRPARRAPPPHDDAEKSARAPAPRRTSAPHAMSQGRRVLRRGGVARSTAARRQQRGQPSARGRERRGTRRLAGAASSAGVATAAGRGLEARAAAAAAVRLHTAPGGRMTAAAALHASAVRRGDAAARASRRSASACTACAQLSERRDARIVPSREPASSNAAKEASRRDKRSRGDDVLAPRGGRCARLCEEHQRKPRPSGPAK